MPALLGYRALNINPIAHLLNGGMVDYGLAASGVVEHCCRHGGVAGWQPITKAEV